MRQRNAGPHPLIVMADLPFEVAPGEVIDFDELLAGCEPVEDDTAENSSDEAPSGKSRKSSKAAASAEAAEEVAK